MSTEGISLNIVENSTSDKLTSGDLKKAWGRLERHWNPKTREDLMQFYTKFLHCKLENVKQRPMDWLVFMEKKRNELANTGHIMDDEMFITHLLNSLPQAEYERARLICQKLNVIIAEKWVILLGTARSHAKTLILLEKMSKTENLVE